MRLALAVILAVFTTGCSVISLDLSPRIRPLEEETVEGSGDSKIALIDVSGFLSDEAPSTVLTLGTPPARVPLLVRVREELKKATDDHAVKALVVRVNTPGGTVTASDVLYRELQLFKAEKKIPVIAVMMDVAASGGYYLSLAADTIVAHPTTVTGSIGVIMLSVNAEGLLQKIGVAASAIKSGARKDMGSPFRALTDEERAIFQSVIDNLYGQFVSKVAEQRKIAPEAARALADGRIYTAEQALALHLVDRIGYMPDALALARQAIGVDKARVVVYHRPRQYRATYYAGVSETVAGLDFGASAWGALMGAGPGPKFLYLWSP